MTFGQKLKALRLQRKLSQKGLAEAAGLHHNFVARIERDERKCSFETAIKIAKALAVKLEKLAPDE